jgi:phosphatidylserine decarboxylase
MKTKPNLFQIHKDGYLFVCIFAIVTAFLGIIWGPLGWIGIILTLWCIYFFRDPDRVIPLGNYILSPADGVVSKITTVAIPKELKMGDEKVIRISIFLNIFNVHVNRAPAEGKITKVLYHPGKFFNASLDKASVHNERNHVAMKLSNGKSLIFTQIAGLIARRIVCEVDQDQKIKAGERYGLIRFGSRVDVYLPKGEIPAVLEKQKVLAGETILAKIGSKEIMKGSIR